MEESIRGRGKENVRVAKKERKNRRERKTIAFDLEQKCTHTSPRTGYSVDMKEIFLRSIVAWPKVN